MTNAFVVGPVRPEALRRAEVTGIQPPLQMQVPLLADAAYLRKIKFF